MATTWELRFFSESVPNLNNLFHEFSTKSLLTGFIPSGGVHHVLFYLGSEFDPSRHELKRERRRDFMSSSDTEEAGFCW